MIPLEGIRVLITGGTGSLGKALVTRMLSGRHGVPESVTVFSRGEVKQHEMRLEYQHRPFATDEAIYNNSHGRLQFIIGDVRDYWALSSAIRGMDLVIHAAALKQVPTCEYSPSEAVLTNVQGSMNLIRAAQDDASKTDTVIGISSDKAAEPINAYGMTKALMERLFVAANLPCPEVRFACVRYGNVLGSRGSVIPLFLDQIRRGGPVTVTNPAMTRFLLPLEQAVDTVMAAVQGAKPGEVHVPRITSATMGDLAMVMIGDRRTPLAVTGDRPGEKLHEVMVTQEEARRTEVRGEYYVVRPMLRELPCPASDVHPILLDRAYSSDLHVMGRAALASLLKHQGMLPKD